MASILARQALARRALTARSFTTTTRRLATGEEALRTESKRNPELIILGSLMVVALAGAGFYFGRSPTASTSEVPVNIKGMPWETSTEGKYQYHPGGDPSKEPQDAPSAINVVIVPDVNLPKELHDKYNKWGKDGY